MSARKKKKPVVTEDNNAPVVEQVEEPAVETSPESVPEPERKPAKKPEIKYTPPIITPFYPSSFGLRFEQSPDEILRKDVEVSES